MGSSLSGLTGTWDKPRRGKVRVEGSRSDINFTGGA